MDIVTQGLIGAIVAQTVAKPKETRLASLVGFFTPLLADADALIHSSDDPLLFLDYHRHFTHTLWFIPIGALVASFLFWPFLKNRLAFNKIYLYALISYSTAGIVDACTSYGTYLLWPFSEERIAWSIISIFDPLFSIVLIVAMVVGIVKRQQLAARIGLMFAVGYLSLGFIQHERVEVLAYQLAQQRGHSAERLIVKPTIGNLLLWRSVYETDGVYYVDAMRVGVGSGRVFAGESVPVFELERDLPQLADESTVARDIQRFKVFSDGFLAWHPERSTVLGDVRYAMLPHSIRPLWGIGLNLDAPNEHVTFEIDRTMTQAERQLFFDMLLN